MMRNQEHRRRLATGLTVFAVVLLASLFGILTRPVGFLAAFWPANALLLGLMVRYPALTGWSGWVGAIAGYYAADLLTGGDVLLTTWLTGANLAGVTTGVLLYRGLDAEDRDLARPLSVLRLFMVLVASAAAATMAGAWIAPVYFEKDLLQGLAFWFTTELANGIILVPVILTAPSPFLPRARSWLRRQSDGRSHLSSLAPVLALAGSVVLGLLVGGPGALAFPSPALLWCALTFSVFPTVVLTMLVSVWHLIGVSLGVFTPETGQLDGPTMSGRLGVMLFALGPLTVASVNMARNELLRNLERLATYDALTGALTRGVFLQQGEQITSRPGRQRPVTVLMFDIDRFKAINDSFGHAAGDRVLVAFAAAVRRSLRQQDLFGRIGGEEFAAILPDTTAEEASRIAERLRAAIEDQVVPLDGHADPLRITVSIGYVHDARTGAGVLDQLLALADAALYAAKHGGRNRVVSAPV